MLCFQAVCCSDKIHCCEKGQTCDVEKGACKGSAQDSSSYSPWRLKLPGQSAFEEQQLVREVQVSAHVTSLATGSLNKGAEQWFCVREQSCCATGAGGPGTHRGRLIGRNTLVTFSTL